MDVPVLEVTIVSLKHLPKTDTLGACDPFISIEFCGNVQKTSVKKRVYSADYNETFTFSIIGNEPGPVAFNLFDWNMTSSNEMIGSSFLSWDQISEILSQSKGYETSLTLNFNSNGKTVNGNDKAATELNVRFRKLSASSNGHLSAFVRRKVG